MHVPLVIFAFAGATALAAEAVKATAAESTQAKLAAFKAAVDDPPLASRLPCPAGTRQYANAGSIYCAVERAAWGKGRNGLSLRFHENGKLAEQGAYKESKASGPWWRFDDQGRAEAYAEYEAGVEHGLSVRFHPNGKHQAETRYVKGKRDGVEKMWTEEGELWTAVTYKAGAEVGRKVYAVTLKAPTQADADEAMKKLREAQEEQRKLLEQQAGAIK